MESSAAYRSDIHTPAFPYPLHDSHHHVWDEGNEPYPYHPSQSPPPNLRDKGKPEDFLRVMKDTGVDKSLIVQPILHMFDHSYVQAVIAQYPDHFTGMLNADPTQGPEHAVSEIRRLRDLGFCSIRVNPYLWPEGEKMDNSVGHAIFREAGKLDMPVAPMLFKGLHQHIQEVTSLSQAFPETQMIIDHWGFFHQQGEDIEQAFHQLLDLARFPQVAVKISAFFRVTSKPYPFRDLAPRLEQLKQAYGSQRLMWGSDFPYVLTLGGGYQENPACVLKWREEGRLPSFGEQDYSHLFSQTFERMIWSRR